MFKIAMKNERGIGLIEVLIALAILGIVAAAFLSGLATASRAIYIADIRTTAESLARSQMEYVKNHSYEDGATEYETDPNLLPTPVGYDVSTSVNPLPDPDNPGNDLVDIQKITVTVEHLTEVKITLEDYKVNR